MTAKRTNGRGTRISVPDARPDPKVKPRGERRYRRKVAGPKAWAAIRTEKLYGQPCRVCCAHLTYRQLHHLVPRSQGGDDVANNLVPLCATCHVAITLGEHLEQRELAESLSDAEYAYVIGKLGENALERLFGVASPGGGTEQ